MATETISYSSYELQQQMDVNSVRLLREMHGTPDLYLRQRYYEQAEVQEATLFSEMLEGSVSTDFTFETQEGKLYLLQPNGVMDWGEMHANGVRRAQAKAEADPQFLPYLEMSVAELEEARAQEAMVRGGRAAAMVKLSLSGNDVMPADRLQEIGRDPDLQRAFLRVSVFDGQNLHIHSRSIDGVSLADGRGIAVGWGTWDRPQTALDTGASSVDILNNGLYFDGSQMRVEEMHRLADELVNAYDTLQTSRTGRIFKAGRCPQGEETYRFVRQNGDLLNAHMLGLSELASRFDLTDADLADITNNLRYDIVSSLKQRLEGTWVDLGDLSSSVSRAGDIERQEGTKYNGCDTVIGSGTAEGAGYVNGQNHETNTKCVKCPNCKKIVDLPEELLRKNIIHCVNCKASVHKQGGKVDQKAIDDFYGLKRQDGQANQMKTWSEYWSGLVQEDQQRKLRRYQNIDNEN